jgi:predicted Rossmann fold flavoprotein
MYPTDMKRIIVIGAGASGLAASIEAGMAGASVTVLEGGKRAGKKLLSTGNGRCNFTNLDINTEEAGHETEAFKRYASSYHSGDSSVVRSCISIMDGESVVRWFDALGVPCAVKDTLVYPRSMQAASVLDALRFKAAEAAVSFIYETKALSIRYNGNSLTVITDKERYEADAVIVSAGGRAMPSSGSDGSGASICRGLGHRIVPETPALVPLKCGGLPFGAIAGVRAQAAVKAYAKERLLAEDKGEVQFTSYGLSGIPVMQVSGAVSRALREGERCAIGLDLMPEATDEAFAEAVEIRAAAFSGRDCSQLLLGLFPRKLHEALLKQSGVPLQQKIGTYFSDGKGSLDRKRLAAVARYFKHLMVPVEGTMGWEHAQVTSGGVAVYEVDPLTMESRLVPGVYITGELLDVDGPCGGYNLHWAWATGILAGRSAAAKRPRPVKKRP